VPGRELAEETLFRLRVSLACLGDVRRDGRFERLDVLLLQRLRLIGRRGGRELGVGACGDDEPDQQQRVTHQAWIPLDRPHQQPTPSPPALPRPS
jgi:hypothetical protein